MDNVAWYYSWWAMGHPNIWRYPATPEEARLRPTEVAVFRLMVTQVAAAGVIRAEIEARKRGNRDTSLE